ncbi:dipeptide epimerase [Pseudokordiimonas caeni]|uniref:dipeptide epimerase n=1 Tax=Pseudokordiimonas caeni TaxID=2997908 RepID=UPI002811AA26|nr:dipeptide epimerase [Pseudokordiimonas caeni]
MRITGYRLGLLKVPLVTPFKTALRSVDTVEDIVLKLETDAGICGWGEAPPTAAITGETHESILRALRSHLLPGLIGRPVDELPDFSALPPGNTSALAATEIALFDLQARAAGKHLAGFLGGGPLSLETDITISLDSVEKMEADTRAAIKAGFGMLKVKVGRDADLDLARVKAVHAAAGGRAAIRLDANQGWTAEETVRLLDAIETAGIELDLIEQPVPASDLDGLLFVRKRTHVPVLADESAFNATEARRVLDMGAADIVNIKLMKAGGIRGALAIVDTVRSFGASCMMGAMMESSISAAAAAHLAAAASDVITRIDLDGPALCTHDPAEGGSRFAGPSITLNETPGLGISSVASLTWLD